MFSILTAAVYSTTYANSSLFARGLYLLKTLDWFTDKGFEDRRLEQKDFGTVGSDRRRWWGKEEDCNDGKVKRTMVDKVERWHWTDG